MLKYEKEYKDILKAELIPSLGCTEPIAIALVAARTKELLGSMPTKMRIFCSANIIKNVKSVIVPNSGHHKGVEVAAILGAVGGDASLGLLVLSKIKEEDIKEMELLLEKKDFCQLFLVENEENLYIKAEFENSSGSACVELEGTHTGIVQEWKNGELTFHKDMLATKDSLRKDLLSFKDIYDFASLVELDDIKPLLKKQITYNEAIAKEGLTNKWGANIGQLMLNNYEEDIKIKIKAKSAAASDARMNGCMLPVVINSGSGNQGIAVCIPVLEYAKELKSEEDELYRALILANLIAIYLKLGIGRLSAFCGVVSASAAAMAGVTYLKSKDYNKICKCIINTLATDSGIVCDGAKSSCAAKICTALDAALLGHFMAMEDRVFEDGDGIVKGDIEQMLANISRLGREGMKNTDIEILNMMIEK